MQGLIAAILALALLGGCASKAAYKDELESWVGVRADDLVASWGVPDSVYALDDGGKVLTYKYELSRVGGDATGVWTKRSHCTTSFRVSSDGIVRSYRASGNACAA